MTQPPVLECRDLRRALAAIEAATAGLSHTQLEVHAEGKWSVSQILEHLALAFGATTKGLDRCLEAGRSSASAPTLKQRFITTVVAGLGYLPSGRQAPERTRPKGIPAQEAMEIVRARLIAMDEALTRCERHFGSGVPVLDHPFLGPLSARQWRRFHWVHTRHHMKQISRMRESVPWSVQSRF